MSIAVRVLAPFMLSPEEGAMTVVWLSSSPDMEGIAGKYYAKQREKTSSEESYDLEVASRLWKISAELTKLD